MHATEREREQELERTRDECVANQCAYRYTSHTLSKVVGSIVLHKNDSYLVYFDIDSQFNARLNLFERMKKMDQSAGRTKAKIIRSQPCVKQKLA